MNKNDLRYRKTDVGWLLEVRNNSKDDWTAIWLEELPKICKKKRWWNKTLPELFK